MAYRNADDGEDGVSGVASYVVNAATHRNREYGSRKKVIIGLETKKPGSMGVIPKITIRRMNRERLWGRILKPLGRKYRETSAVGGIAPPYGIPVEMQKRWAEEQG